MIGLMFLGVALLWLGLTVYLTIKLPRWLGLKSSTGWLLRLVLVPLLLVGPFVDEIVGMRQFERLCSEARNSIWLSPTAGSVKRAKTNTPAYTFVPSLWIDVEVTKTMYLDVDTNQPFLIYNTFFTKGGRIWGLLLMGGTHSCRIDSSPQFTVIWKQLNIQQLLDEGRKS